MKLTIPPLVIPKPIEGIRMLSDAHEDTVVELQEGQHTFTTAPIKLAHDTVNQAQPFVARLEMSYEYLPGMNAVKLAGSEYTGAYAPRLVVGDDSATWLQSELATVINSVLEQIIENAEQAKLMALVRKDLPPLNKEQEEELLLVYRDGFYLEPYYAGCVLQDNDKIVPVTSVYGGTFVCPQGRTFYNVSGSRNDPRPDSISSWIEFWEVYTGLEHRGCIAFGSAQIQCNNLIYGGHLVVNNANNRVVPDRANQVAFILPLCNKHNNWRNNKQMAAAYTETAVWLNNYNREGDGIDG